MDKEKNRNKSVDYTNLPIVDELFDFDDLELISKKEDMKINSSKLEEGIKDSKIGKPLIQKTLNGKNYLPIPKFEVVVNLMYRLKEIDMKNQVIAELHGRVALLESLCVKNGINVNIDENSAKELDNVIEATSTMLVDGMRDVGSFNMLPDKMSSKLHYEISKQVVEIKQDVRITNEYQLIINTNNIKMLQEQVEAVRKSPILAPDEKAKELRQLAKAIMDLSNNNEKLQGRNKTTIETIGGSPKEKDGRIKDPIDITSSDLDMTEVEGIGLEFSVDK